MSKTGASQTNLPLAAAARSKTGFRDKRTRHYWTVSMLYDMRTVALVFALREQAARRRRALQSVINRGGEAQDGQETCCCDRSARAPRYSRQFIW